MRLIASLILLLMVSCAPAPAYAQIKCPSYTTEQLNRIQAAYDYGVQHGYPFTLPAIVVKESFVEDKIVRYNPSDPSTGITQIQFATLRHLSGLNRYAAAREAERLLVDDELAFHYAVAKLNSIKSTSKWYKWKRYNGQGRKANLYANKIQSLTQSLQFCLKLTPTGSTVNSYDQTIHLRSDSHACSATYTTRITASSERT
jgi:hypothetical protein